MGLIEDSGLLDPQPVISTKQSFIGGMRKSSEGAIFKRELKTTHSLLGSQIIDSAIIPNIGDLFDGQAQFMPSYTVLPDGSTTLAAGELPIGSTHTGCFYLLETPVNRKPLFGSGTLIGMDLNIYHSNID